MTGIEQLQTACIGRKVALKDFKVKVRSASDGCRDCVFETEDGASYCGYSLACMAHVRPDRKPVKFVLAE